MERLFRQVVHHPWVILLLLVLMTVGLGSQLPKTTMETNIEEMLPKALDAYINKKRLEEDFNAADMVVIGILNETDPHGIYNPHTLKLVDELTNWLRTRKEFRTIGLSDLLSLSTIKDIRGTADGMEVELFMPSPPKDRTAIERLRQRLEDNGIYMGSIVSRDGKGTLIVVRPDPSYLGRYHEIHALLTKKLAEIEKRGGPEKLLVTGRPIIEGVFGIYMPQDMQRMQPLIIGLLVLLLALSFRNVRGVVLPLASVVLAEIWMVGTMAAAGVPFYTVTSMLPVLILAVGIAYAVHLVTHAQVDLGRHPDKQEALVTTMNGLWMPMLMTTLTTAAGFLSMLTSELVPMRWFGVFAAIGVSYAFIISFLLIPAAFALLPAPKRKDKPMAFGGYLDWMTRIVVHHPRRVLAAFGLAMLVSSYGLSQIDVDSSLVSEFRPSDPIRQADEILNARFAGTNTLDAMIDTGRQDGVLDPQILKGLIRMQQAAESDPLVGDSSSIAEFLAEMNKVMHAGEAAWKIPPEASDLAAQYLLLYSFSGAPDDFDAFITSDYRQAHLRIQLKNDSSHAATHLIHALQAKTGEWLGDAKVDYAGTAYTIHRFSDLVITGQIKSLVAALVLIFALCLWLFHNLWDAALAMLPVSMAVVVCYGVMGLVGLPLEIGTAITGAMALGIGVDFAIHYLYRYRYYEKQGHDYGAVVAEANQDTGRAILFNAVVVIGGFLVLLTAQLYPQVKLGALIAGSMAVCYLATCYLFPVLLARRED
ncbi:MAG: RND family transporter [Candidatus Dadabacteria bacterium]|nr:MAG: RND family transporter [Candidatus Dadabacteria bacterium]